jgi:hypothetical protein
MEHRDRTTIAALSVLIVLQTIMLTALYAAVAPHPPASTPVFGMAPFIAASMSAAIAAIVIGPLRSGAGRILSLIAVALALVSFGPQKYLDPQFRLIWPAVIAGQIAAVTIVLHVIGGARRLPAEI